MTLALETPWVFLDEPLAALDPRHARDLMTCWQGLTRNEETSLLVMMHDLMGAAHWADRVLALKNGRVFACGATADVLTAEKLTTVFDTPFETAEMAGRLYVSPV